MKNMICGLLVGACIALGAVFGTGCDKIEWTPQVVYQSCYCVGITASAVVDSQHYPAEVTDGILSVMDLCRSAVPNDGKTFTQTWLPIADDFLAKATKIPEAYKPLIKLGAQAVCTALDTQAAKHPEILKGEEYVRAAIDGTLNGFQVYIKPSNNGECTDCCLDCCERGFTGVQGEVDYKLYKTLQRKIFNK